MIAPRPLVVSENCIPPESPVGVLRSIAAELLLSIITTSEASAV